MNQVHRSNLDAGSAPSPADEYLLYQTLLGTLPPEALDEGSLAAWRERIERYMIKAAREAKANTSWISPNEEYEHALTGFVRGLLGRLQPNPFLDELRAQAEPVAWFGALNSLSMALVKFTSPGVPDIYQGNDIMDLRLVDPDNRRPVDYAKRDQLLDAFAALTQQPELGNAVRALAAAPHDGRAKLWLTWRVLEARRKEAELFRDGDYLPLKAHGAKAEHVLAYARRQGGKTLVVIAGRLFAKLLGEAGKLPLGEEVWADTAIDAAGLADGTPLENLITGETIEVAGGHIALARAVANFPAAALIG